MIRKRTQKNKANHIGILVNKAASEYNARSLKKLVAAVRTAGDSYTVFEPETADELYQTGLRMCGLKRWHRGAPAFLTKRGPVTALVACGGDGTFNITAEVAMRAEIPVGIIPVGRLNSLARSLYGDTDPDTAIAKIVAKKFKKVDVAMVHGRPFFGSLGTGFMVELAKVLSTGKRPRFGIGWSQLGSRAAAEVKPKPIVVKIDAFRFEFTPIMFNISIHPHTLGLPFSPASSASDGQVEVIFDLGQDPKLFSHFLKQVYKKKYLYGAEVKLFRGKAINLQIPKGTEMCLDGELVHAPAELLNIKIEQEKLKVFC
jgi:diacylglycerol kinase family enzyme